MRALPVEIYKHGKGDYSNGGISSKYNEILVEHPRGHVEVDENNLPENFCKVVKRNLFGSVYVHIEPYTKANGVGWMYGGCIVDTSDSRFKDVTGVDYPIHLHDRCESQKLYDELSK